MNRQMPAEDVRVEGGALDIQRHADLTVEPPIHNRYRFFLSRREQMRAAAGSTGSRSYRHKFAPFSTE